MTRNGQPYIASGYMGNHGAIRQDPACRDNPHGGATCMQWTYDAVDNWAGVMWQSPPNDWGQQPGGYDLTGATDLVLWARGAEGGEILTFFVGGLGKDLPYPDSDRAELKELTLRREWTRYRVPLDGRDLTRIKMGFAWSLGGQGRPLTFFLDDIVFQ